jgi:hypothetical protein
MMDRRSFVTGAAISAVAPTVSVSDLSSSTLQAAIQMRVEEVLNLLRESAPTGHGENVESFFVANGKTGTATVVGDESSGFSKAVFRIDRGWEIV